MAAAGKFAAELVETANKISTPGKGILAADESTGTMGKRLASIGQENTEELRRAWRQLMFSTAAESSKAISGVIMFEETLFQSDDAGVPFPQGLAKHGIVTGIKLDKGLKQIPGAVDGEMDTQGFDDLGARCDKYYAAGARFSKWRCTLKIDTAAGAPSQLAIHRVAQTLARYASISQAHGLVPIVEPETLLDGTHTIEECANATEKVLAAVFAALNEHKILLEGCLLKPSFMTAGAESPTKAAETPEAVAAFTLRTLRRTVPVALPGIFFLSGGNSEEDSTRIIDALNKHPLSKGVWHLSFSFGRALQASGLKAWKGEKANVKAAQEVFLARALANGQGQLGQYTKGSVSHGSESLYQKGYTY
mmetsp:Transcript_1923/g.6101  ORF Transcript_1923/g.6101 Transcript_1923/m.6101 type:complete len:364 (-) Transcript_1923:367-1458(-)